MVRGSSQSQSSSSPNSRPGLVAPRGSAAATAGIRRRRPGATTAKTTSTGHGGGGATNLLRFYTEDAPGYKIGPTIVLVISLCFIGFVSALHVFGKLYRS
ncbi:hypothetical protein CsatB_030670 [Cannabis sativa]|uniref:Protein transport protein Sec61 subunit beta n=2 Tax=Cannabis sativa TaxID=3483 RepID=A0A7J6EAC9_CANSA|nr:protein transport protein Sec61 subunit beta [Cannabis sativa]KAF4354659.1 hypothetical protein F8388_009650 [Cannabis sativa]KAF4392366.1 hypothetical protein G4B88_005325 [Cannabis sativa]